jgi:hypothetical protein
VKIHLQVVANHHLQNEEKLSIRDEAISIYVVHLERDCQMRVCQRLDAKNSIIVGRTLQFLFSSTSTTKRAQTANEFLEIDSTSTTRDQSETAPTRRFVSTHSSSKIAIIREARGLVAI